MSPKTVYDLVTDPKGWAVTTVVVLAVAYWVLRTNNIGPPPPPPPPPDPPQVQVMFKEKLVEVMRTKDCIIDEAHLSEVEGISLQELSIDLLETDSDWSEDFVEANLLQLKNLQSNGFVQESTRKRYWLYGIHDDLEQLVLIRVTDTK